MAFFRYSILAVLAAGLLLPSVYGLQFPVSARLKHRAGQSGFGKRQSAGQTSTSGDQMVISLKDLQDVEYTSMVWLEGQPFTVLLDTGSADLNIMGTIPTAKDTGIPVTVNFASGAEEGQMSFGNVTFAGYTVQQQVFNHVSVNAGASSQNGQDQGLLGLGMSSGSVLHKIYQQTLTTDTSGMLNPTWGDALLDRIFQQNPSTSNFMSFTLARDMDTAETSVIAVGNFTLSELVPGMENITTMPKLPVITPPQGQTDLQHWTVAVDGIMANDVAFTLPQSVVAGAAAGSMVAVLDSGFTFPQVPPSVAQAFYGSIPGAVLSNASGVIAWTFPCKAQVNASFMFAGVNYPIHPLDMSFDPATVGQPLPNNTCIGAFQPIQADALQALDGVADMVLGMAFLRNTYTLMNYGDFVDSAADATAQPYVQLLSTTDAAAAAACFTSVRDPPPVYNGYASPTNELMPAFVVLPTFAAICLLVFVVWLRLRRTAAARDTKNMRQLP
ncbi:acid protease [Dacryopinax primogenitus]|uniref:Acid protease n=1 Tax=Dacryopinax primogenitus (strain DJM 731) TaxID=1858805 RepID=M5G5I6_DACPD|nr:acid protease [Dacryopinax primogenitus]EJU05521.1 acid protease [Dacryopinax primogenitus]